MSGQKVAFPDTVEEFMEQYKMVDTDHVYSNGIECVPIFRMRQWFEHLPLEQYKRPVGEWECLGHRIGFLKHPLSIDYKCSVCGYEQYTIGFMPPKTCPECGADMRESVSELERQMMFPEEEKDESNVRD